jgi:hypothetical protein
MVDVTEEGQGPGNTLLPGAASVYPPGRRPGRPTDLPADGRREEAYNIRSRSLRKGRSERQGESFLRRKTMSRPDIAEMVLKLIAEVEEEFRTESLS